MVIVANYLQNRMMLIKDLDNENGQKRTPYELWFKHQPDLSYLWAWGCQVIYYKNNLDSKLDSQVVEGIFILYEKSDKQYYILL